jgi:hypothetical protein
MKQSALRLLKIKLQSTKRLPQYYLNMLQCVANVALAKQIRMAAVVLLLTIRLETFTDSRWPAVEKVSSLI